MMISILYCLQRLMNILLNYFFVSVVRTEFFSENKTMANSPDTCVDIELFQDDFHLIDRDFIRKIVSIFCDQHYGYLCMTNGATYAFGKYICSWLSLKHDPTRPKRINILNRKKIIQVVSGNFFVAILTCDGKVYLASDHNTEWNTKSTLRLISTGDDCYKMIACGSEHLLMLRQDGHLFAIGDNKYGQITGSSVSSYDTLVNTGLTNVEKIACGLFHCLALTNTNKFYSWGINLNGQLGLGDENERRTPSLVSFKSDLINNPVKNIVAGSYHSLFLLEDGQIFGCGHLQLGIKVTVPTKIPLENVQNVTCKNYLEFSLALVDSSQYYVWGKDENSFWSQPQKLNGQLKSFADASAMISKYSMTYGLTSTIDVFESNCPILNRSITQLFNNLENYDFEFIIGNKRIMACKSFLKSASRYFFRTFFRNWRLKDSVTIEYYSYDIFYSYIRMLHDGYIRIDMNNITDLIDLAHFYDDEQLMEYCQTFIRKNLTQQSIHSLIPLIINYKLDELDDDLCQYFEQKTLPKFCDNLLMADENTLNHFLNWFYQEQTLFLITKS
ncbi:RCC1 and BTB domain-containing protein 1-like [Dermatophagoides pteronyssinus]|uniref:RCC1 and BTB domain-containing protein 1-like n=1 Tax=Dermatophagoides pteronyssinus TaxID=6956 RepID=UPI003F6726AD